MLAWLKTAPQPKASPSRSTHPALPDPNAEPTEGAAAATEAANRAIQEEVLEPAAKRQKRAYSTHPPEFRAKVAKYALQHNNSRAAKHFSTTEKKVGESTVCNWVKELKKQMAADNVDYNDVKALKAGDKGRPTLLPKFIDTMVQQHIKKLRLAGGIVNRKIAIATARGLVTHHDRTLLQENGGYILLGRSWSESLFQRMGYVQRKGTKAGRKLPNDFSAIKEKYLLDIKAIVKEHNIPDELIVNFDQTGVSIIPVDDWTMEKEGSKDVSITGLEDKRMITVLLCYSLSLDMLPPQAIYQGTTTQCHPKGVQFPEGWNISHSKNHWSTTDTMKEYFDKVLLPTFKKIKAARNLPESQQSLVVMDCYKVHQTEEVINHLKTNNCQIKFVPASCTGDLQPLDVSGNQVYKGSMEDSFTEWYSDKVADSLKKGIDLSTVQASMTLTEMKPIHARWLIRAFDKLKSSPTAILRGWEQTGIRGAVDLARK